MFPSFRGGAPKTSVNNLVILRNLWNNKYKSDYLSVESDGLKVIYKGVISFDKLKMSDIQQWHIIYVVCISF